MSHVSCDMTHESCLIWHDHLSHASFVLFHGPCWLRPTQERKKERPWISIAHQRKMTTMTFSCVIRTPFGLSIPLLTLSVIFRFRWLIDRLGLGTPVFSRTWNQRNLHWQAVLWRRKVLTMELRRLNGLRLQRDHVIVVFSMNVRK